MVLVKHFFVPINMALLENWIMYCPKCVWRFLMPMGRVRCVNWRGETCLFQSVPNLALWTWLASQILRIPQRLILMTHTDISWSRVFFTSRSHIVINSSSRTGLTQARSRVPKRIFLITVDFNAFIQVITKSEFLWTCFISFNASFVVVVPLFTCGAGLNTLLISIGPDVVKWTGLALSSFRVEWGSRRGALETLEVDRIPVWGGWGTHGCSTSFFAGSSLWIVELISRTRGVLAFGSALFFVLVKNLLIGADSAYFSDRIIIGFLVATLVTGVGDFVPEGPFRGTQGVSIVVLGETLFCDWVKVIALAASLLGLTNSRVLVPSLVQVAFTATLKNNVEIRGLGGTRLTWITQRVPEGSRGRTWTFIRITNHSRAFSERLVKKLSSRTVSVVPACVRGEVQNKGCIFAILRAVLLAKPCTYVEERLVSRAGETGVLLNLDPGLAVGTGLEFELRVLLSFIDLSLVLGLGSVAPVPAWHIQVIPVCILDHFTTFRVDRVLHDSLVAFHHFQFVVEFFN